jgi:hypothetical protein
MPSLAVVQLVRGNVTPPAVLLRQCPCGIGSGFRPWPASTLSTPPRRDANGGSPARIRTRTRCPPESTAARQCVYWRAQPRLQRPTESNAEVSDPSGLLRVGLRAPSSPEGRVRVPEAPVPPSLRNTLPGLIASAASARILASCCRRARSPSSADVRSVRPCSLGSSISAPTSALHCPHDPGSKYPSTPMQHPPKS